MRALHAWVAQYHIVFQQNAHRMTWTQFYQLLLRECVDERNYASTYCYENTCGALHASVVRYVPHALQPSPI
jgi:hypothetical protein